MIQYKYNLLGRFPEKDYKKVADRALTAARRASAVDTGAYRRSWRVRLVGDFLFVFSNLRYAAPVELGSSVHKVHKHKIRNALSRIGLGTGTVSLGQGVETPIRAAAPGTPRAAAPGTPRAAASRPTVSPLTPQEIRSPALLRNRFTLPDIPRPQRQNRAALLAALAALAAAQEEEQPQEN